MNGLKLITIDVRRSGDTSHARTVTGPAGYRRSASSTNSPYFAALAAAEKFFQPKKGERIVLTPTLEVNMFAGSYTAALTAGKGRAS